jgi:hypothetical protein
MAHIVFLSLYLGLVSGRQPIELQADPVVTALRLELDGKPVASLTSPPWRATVDFGPGIEPQELVATGFDKNGVEVGRATQSINLPRPVAETEIVIEHDAKGGPVGAEIRWRHIGNEEPRRKALRLDDKPLAIWRNKAKLPRLDLTVPHVLAAEVQFPTGVARREVVFGGTLPDTAGSQLTATLVSQTGTLPASLDGCFLVNGQPIRAQALEKSEALVIIIRDPNPYDALAALVPAAAKRTIADQNVTQRVAAFDSDTRIRLQWPVADRIVAPDAPTSVLFRFSGDFDASQGGALWHLLSSHESKGDFYKRQFADAVAVAGVQAMTGARRRAVILALGRQADTSRYDPATVRRYLAGIGVPLFVWSLTGPQSEPAAKWGDVVDISSQEKLRMATEAVKKNLAAQRIAWLDADPIHALRAEVKPECGLTLVARR